MSSFGRTVARYRASVDHRDTGFVVVWFAICGSVFMGFCGMAVDVGNWYLHVSRTQNAADAAALAGAPFLPGSPDDAKAASNAVLAANKVAPADVTFNGPDPGAPSFMQVKVADSVDTIFLKFFDVPRLDFQRNAFASMRQAIAMGSPDNTLGIQRGAPSWSTSGVSQGFWLSENTRNRPKQNADRWSSIPCNSSQTDYCVKTSGKNDEYTPGGRDFVIEVPAGSTGYLAIEGYDLTMHDSAASADPNDKLYSSSPSPSTDVQLFQPDGYSFPTGKAVPGCPKQTYGPNLTMQWDRICTVFIDGTVLKAGDYHLVIDMPNSFSDNGSNSYSLRAGFLTGPTGTIDMVKSKGIMVFAPGRLVTRHDPGVEAKYYMAQVPSGYAGQSIAIDMFDFGETGIDSVAAIWADGSPSPSGCSMEIRTTGLKIPEGTPCSFDMKPYGSGDLDRRVITLTVPLPKSYVCTPVNVNSCWIIIDAVYPKATQEGASFSVGGVGNPLRLYNQPS